MADTEDGNARARGRRGALRTALILALVALAFYVGIFLIVSWRHP
ncbi:MAG TPA: hypothetical protein VKT74_02440 [Gammaproteobacteria bacterium]|nr:hypothetical protein [Gammaproteobacteria bacterium]